MIYFHIIFLLIKSKAKYTITIIIINLTYIIKLLYNYENHSFNTIGNDEATALGEGIKSLTNL